MAKLPSLERRTARGGWGANWPQAQAMLAALLVMSSAAMVPASAMRGETLASVAPPSAPWTAPKAPAAPSPDRSWSQKLAAEPDIDAVAAVLARRYRISQAATRELVGTAYREGQRIGLDPLLIIAVMAVESRFNPIAQSDGGAIGLMQVIPRYHADQFDPEGGKSVLEPRTNIELGARVLKDYIRQAGTEMAGLQLYNGAAGDASNGYANKVLGERQRLQEAVRRSRDRSRA